MERLRREAGLLILAPPPELRACVRAFYRIDAASREASSAAKPDEAPMIGGPSLAVDLWWLEGLPLIASQAGRLGHICRGSFVEGPLTRMMFLQKGRRLSGVGVSLKPEAAAALLGIEPLELVDQYLDMEGALKRRAPGLNGPVLDAGNPSGKLSALRRGLLELLRRRPEADRRASGILSGIGRSLRGASVNRIAREIGLTRRALNNLCARCFGVSPRELIRILRFRRALGLMKRPAPAAADWPSIVYECGYADQSHFIRHCRRLTGLTPGELVEWRAFPPLLLPIR